VTNVMNKGNRTKTGVASAVKAPSKFRADIQGLRALAVLAVIADHLFAWPSGGFVGVDVFFVISGFLITGILIREYEKTGRISFVDFYRRRVKRIIPAAALVLVTTVAVASVLFNKARFSETVTDSIFAFLFSANWRFAASGTDYFQAGGPVSPLQHFWSLSVEEQFYFVWPLLMIAVLMIATARGAQRRRVVVGMVMAAIIIASFLWAMVETATAPTLAYFSTFTRAWELGIGALLAIASPLLRTIPTVLRPVLAWVGFAGIIASIFVVNDSMPFPAPWAALPVLATALVIGAGTGEKRSTVAPLTNRAAVYVGNISYSLYLWHFPVIILGAALVADDAWFRYPVLLVVMFAASIAAYHFVEVPLHKSPMLERHGANGGSRAAWRVWRNKYGARYKFGILPVLTAATVILAGVALVPPPASPNANGVPQAAAAVEPTEGAAPVGEAVSSLQAEITTALGSTAWPELSPSLDDVIGGPQAPEDIAECGLPEAPSLGDCTWGSSSATKTAVVVGDSTGVAYVEAVRSVAAMSDDWRVISLAAFGCTFVDIAVPNSDEAAFEACPAKKARAIETINELKPDVVFITNTYEPRTDGATGKRVTIEQWKGGMTRLVDQFRSSVGTVAFLSPPPSEAQIAECYTPLSSPQDCATKVLPRWDGMSKAETDLADTVGGVFIDSRPLFCADDTCPAYVGTTPVKLDLVHITSAYAKKIAPAMQSLFTDAGVMKSAEQAG
jgi:peptidoglycan/LPS O-acetylase OafA/YrhL